MRIYRPMPNTHPPGIQANPRMPRPAAAQATRRPTNVTLPAALLTEARTLGLNVSQACEQGLKAEIARLRAAQWREANRAATVASNEFVQRHGLPLSEFRQV